jgi:hypothetical protein
VQVFFFLYEVMSQWRDLMSGAFLIVVLGAFERYRLKQVTWKQYVYLMLWTMFYASFLAWQDENNMVSSVSKELQQVKVEKERIEQVTPVVSFDSYE